MHFTRLTVGRWLVHLGLNVLPPGRVKSEFQKLLEDWADRIEAEVTLTERQSGK